MFSWHKLLQRSAAWAADIRDELFRSPGLGYLIVIAFIVTLGAGFALYVIDPNIHSWFDGIWYAWVTMTHVGYGDVVPVSFVGRLLAAALILFGLGLFAFFTALVSVALMGKPGHVLGLADRPPMPTDGGDAAILQELALIRRRLDQIQRQLGRCQVTPPED